MEAFKDDGLYSVGLYTRPRAINTVFFFSPLVVPKEKRISHHRFFFFYTHTHTRSCCCCTARFCSARTSFFISPLYTYIHGLYIFFCLPHQTFFFFFSFDARTSCQLFKVCRPRVVCIILFFFPPLCGVVFINHPILFFFSRSRSSLI